MFRIGEFSRLTQVSIRMLRYYDEAGLLKPAQVDSWTGHRLYAAEQIPHLNRIRYLRDSGFQVSEIARALEMDDSALLDYLSENVWRLSRPYGLIRKSCRNSCCPGTDIGQQW